MADKIEMARQELENIDKNVAQLMKRRKLLAEFLASYVQLFPDEAEQHDFQLAPQVSTQSRERPATLKDQVIQVVHEILMESSPRPTAQLLEDLQQRGIEIGAKKKVLALSAILSRSGRFKPAPGRAGWVIVG